MCCKALKVFKLYIKQECCPDSNSPEDTGLTRSEHFIYKIINRSRTWSCQNQHHTSATPCLYSAMVCRGRGRGIPAVSSYRFIIFTIPLKLQSSQLPRWSQVQLTSKDCRDLKRLRSNWSWFMLMLLLPTSSLLPQICGQGDPVKARSHRHIMNQGRCHHVTTVEGVNTPTSPYYDGL